MGLVDAVKNFITFKDDEYEEYDENMVEEEAEYEEEEEEELPRKRRGKVVPIEKASGKPSIVIFKLKCSNDAKRAAEQLKMKRPIIIDVNGLDPAEAERVVDYITGASDALNGDIEKITDGVFISIPSSYNITGDKEKSNAVFGRKMYK